MRVVLPAGYRTVRRWTNGGRALLGPPGRELQCLQPYNLAVSGLCRVGSDLHTGAKVGSITFKLKHDDLLPLQCLAYTPKGACITSNGRHHASLSKKTDDYNESMAVQLSAPFGYAAGEKAHANMPSPEYRAHQALVQQNLGLNAFDC